MAPSARAGSKRLAAARSRTNPMPNKASIGFKVDEPNIPKKSPIDEAIEKTSIEMVTKATEQTASEARPAPAASATRIQTLSTALPKTRADRGHGSLVSRRAPRSRLQPRRLVAPALYAIHRSAWKGNSANFAFTEF